MLEAGINQGAGLRLLAAQATPRVLAMASHGEQQDELPLLWNLCSALVDFGYSVAVLDATTAESANNPGLEQLLDDVYWPDPESLDRMSWSVIPAAHGLERLCRQEGEGHRPWQQLDGLLQSYGVIVVYARADILGPLLHDSGIEPLLTVGSSKMSLVSAYQALKHLLLNAKLRPTIASISREPVRNASNPSQAMNKSLQNCAMTYLGYQVNPLTIRATPSDECPSDDIHRLALRLLESAISLHRDASTLSWSRESVAHDHFVERH